MPHEKNKGQKQVLLRNLVQLCNSGSAWGKKTLGSDTLPPKEVRPSMVFPTCHKTFSAHIVSFQPTKQSPLNLGGLFSATCVPSPSSLTKLSCLGPMPPCWEMKKQLILQGPPLLLGSRNSWKPDSCVHWHRGPAQAALSTGWPGREPKRWCLPGARSEKKTREHLSSFVPQLSREVFKEKISHPKKH